MDRADNGQIQSHRGDCADTIRLEYRSVRVLVQEDTRTGDKSRHRSSPKCTWLQPDLPLPELGQLGILVRSIIILHSAKGCDFHKNLIKQLIGELT